VLHVTRKIRGSATVD